MSSHLSRRLRVARGAVRAACLLGLLASGAAAEESAPLLLRYGFAPGQSWRAVYEVARETHLGDDVQRDRGIARFEYRVEAGAQPGELVLEARLTSQETAAGASPLDFSPIRFHTGIDTRGRLRDPGFRVGAAKPPDLPGVEPDPAEYRRMLQQVASAWRGAAFWFPELPERALAPGESFDVEEVQDLADAQPGLGMRERSTRSYRLLSVAGGVARFQVKVDSLVEAGTAQSGIASRQQAEGEALFDLALGMWTRQETRASQRASYSDTGPGEARGDATAKSVTTIEMQRVSAGAAP